MSEITFIPNEKANSQIAGSIFPSGAVRIMLRSPDRVVFNGLGCNIWNRRDGGSWHDMKKLFSNRPTIAEFEAISDKMDEQFGPGVGAAMVRAWRKNETILIDGGGAALPLPNVMQRAISKAAYEKKACDWSADLTGQVKTCKQCGKDLKPDTDHHRFGFTMLPDHPRTVEDCQRRTNQRVIAIHDFGANQRERVGFVRYFETWDGESYMDDDFCHGSKCAADYGRRAARERDLLEPGGVVPKTPYRVREDVEHSKDPERTATLGDGTRIRL